MTEQEVEDNLDTARQVMARLLEDWKQEGWTAKQILEKVLSGTGLPNGVSMTCFAYAVMAERLMKQQPVPITMKEIVREACAPLVKVLEQVYNDHFAMSPPRCRHCQQAIDEALAEFRKEYGP